MLNYGNVITAMITSFNEDCSVNYENTVKLAKYYAENGSDGILVCGTTGEGATMTVDEKLKLFRLVVEAVGDKVMVMETLGQMVQDICFNNVAAYFQFEL